MLFPFLRILKFALHHNRFNQISLNQIVSNCPVLVTDYLRYRAHLGFLDRLTYIGTGIFGPVQIL